MAGRDHEYTPFDKDIQEVNPLSDLGARKKELQDEEDELNKWEKELGELNEDELNKMEEELQAAEEKLKKREKELQAREKALKRREDAVAQARAARERRYFWERLMTWVVGAVIASGLALEVALLVFDHLIQRSESPDHDDQQYEGNIEMARNTITYLSIFSYIFLQLYHIHLE